MIANKKNLFQEILLELKLVDRFNKFKKCLYNKGNRNIIVSLTIINNTFMSKWNINRMLTVYHLEYF